jgi:prepilin-type N-terminal cleavage/methylation domain-containing protein
LAVDGWQWSDAQGLLHTALLMRSERGFTLVEVLTALLILTFVLTTAMYAFLERNKRLQQASEMILAYQALANESEYWRRYHFNELDTMPPAFASPTDVLAPLAPYTALASVKLEKPGVKNVTLTIQWRGGEREARLGIIRVDTGGGPLF